MAKKKPAPNLTARYAARIVRGARNGEIVGFAAVCLTKTGAIETWHAPPEIARRLVGEVHMLNQRVAWEVGGPQAKGDNPLPVTKRPTKADINYAASRDAETRLLRRSRKKK